MADDDEAGATFTSAASAISSVSSAGEVSATFRLLVEKADRKFAHVRDLPPHARGPLHLLYYHKVFKAYTILWRFQQEHRRELVASGLRRWEIGEIASRIGQLYYMQYLRTSELRFLLEAYVFYEAILNRGYFEAARGSPALARTKADLKLRYRELRFYARFLVVALFLNRVDSVRQLADRFGALVEESKTAFPGNSFREWKQMLHEVVRFLEVDRTFTSTMPLRYSAFNSHSSSVPYIARFHANRILKLRDALLTSYHSYEVKLADVTLDTFRMLQCLEWEPSGTFYQTPVKAPSENGVIIDHSGASGLIDINFAADMTDPSLPPNPRKAVMYHPSVSHLIMVLADICAHMPSESILLIYISASGKVDHTDASSNYVPGSSVNIMSHAPKASLTDSSLTHRHFTKKLNSNSSSGRYLCLDSQRTGGLNNLYPEDLLPFTRRPLFLIIDSDSSHTFKTLHSTEMMGEMPALLLSHEKPSESSDTDVTSGGSQFTYFLTAPFQAFCHLVGLSSDLDADLSKDAESLLSSALAEWEIKLCTSKSLDLVWAQVLPDPFLRRLIVRFVFCRAVLCLLRDGIQRLPECLPSLPDSVSPKAAATQTHVFRLAEKLGVVKHFQFSDPVRTSARSR